MIDAKRRVTWRFVDPVDGVWTTKTEIAPDQPLAHPLLPGAAITIGTL